MKYILFALALASCSTPLTKPIDTNHSSVLYEWSDQGRIITLRKVVVDGQDYLVTSHTHGVSIIRHDKPFHFPSWDSTNAEAGDIIVSGSGTVRSLTPKEQKETFGL